MEKAVWREDWPDRIYRSQIGGSWNDKDLDAARGLVVGLAISQIFWIGVALFFI